jgi:hypothetical protein
MSRAATTPPGQNANSGQLPQGEQALSAVREILAPLVRLLVATGIDYTRFSAEMKLIFIDQARKEIERIGSKDTDSAISLLSGIHRKDVRQWRESGLQASIAREIPMSTQVFARWMQERLYLDRRRKPKILPRSGPAPSFESLARSVTQDVHPFTILTDLVRLGVVELAEDNGVEIVIPNPNGFVPPPGSAELVELFRGNLADHAQAAAQNLMREPKLLEQSIFADGITEVSAERLAEMARDIWSDMRREMIDQASQLYENDKDSKEANQRVRFGVYFWKEEQPPAAEAKTAPKRGKK